MKNKLLSILLTICMVALLLPVSVIPAYAETTTETRTVTWPMSTGCTVSGGTLSNTDGNRMVLNNDMIWQQTSDRTGIATYQYNLVTSTYNTEISFPDIEGTVTAVEIKYFSFEESGMNLYAGTSMSSLLNQSTGGNAYASGNSGNYSGNVTFTGTMDVSSSSPLKLMFRAASSTLPEMQIFQFAPNDAWHTAGYISVTYQREVAANPQHTFSAPSVNGNTLTVTCINNGAGHECSLTNRQATLTLTANDGSVSGFQFDAPSLNLIEFNNQTGLGATAGNITYTNKSTGETINSAMYVYQPGAYTANVEVSINSNTYTLSKDFELYDATVNNSFAQFSISPTALKVGDVVTITFTPQLGESVETLTLTGNNTTLTLGNGITDNNDGTYTFTMLKDVFTLSATFNFPLNESNITQSGDTYTIKTADGWDYFCRRMEVDGELNGFSGKTVELAANITVTTMAGNGRYPFKGTFDGKGHTLTFNYTADKPNCAPFQSTNGATIRNLHATGQIVGGNWNYIGGLVGSANDDLTIENCRVSTQISSTISGNAWYGGFVGLLSSQYNQCHITGCVFDGLIYNPNYSGTTYGCGGFVGSFSQYGYAILEDCLFIEGQYDNNNGKCELWWGNENNKNSTFLYRTNNQGEGKLTNCFYVSTHFLKQGSPAVESTDAPTNFAHFGDPTDHRFMQTYGHTMVFNGKYYTPIYGDLVEKYDYSGVKGYNIEYDDAPLGIPDITSPLWTDGLRYNRSFTKDKPVIVMLPFNFTKDNITLPNSSQHPSGHFYSLAGVTGSAPVMESANEVTSMTANTPYLYVPGEDTEYLVFYLYDGFYIFTAGNNGGDKTAVSGGWTLTGTYAPKTWTGAEQDFGRTFILNNSGELTDVTDTTIVKPTDGYFVISENTYTVTFDANGGTGTIAAETVTGGATYTLPACTFTAPEGKIFKEWSVKIGDADPVNKQPNDTIEVTADTIVTAVWEAELADGYYLIGQNGWTVDALDPAQVFTVNPANANEYMLETTLAVGDEIKVVRVANGAIAQWYPDPGDNYTVAADYAGSVTIYFKTNYDSAWSAFGGHIWIVKKAPSFATQSLILSGQIGLSFNMDLPDIEGVDWTESYMTFAIPHGTCTERADYADSSAKKSGNRGFVCYVNAVQMAEPITATFHWTEGGEEKTIEKTYAIKDYFFAYDGKKDTFLAPVQKLIESTADYGHYVQAYLADAKGWTLGEDGDYYEMDKCYTTAYDYDNTAAGLAYHGAFTCENDGADMQKLSFATILDSATAIRLLITPTSGYTGTVTASADQGKEVKVNKVGNRYFVDVPDLAAHELSKTYTITVTTENGTATITTSALSYVKLLFNAYETTSVRNAASAILGYASAAYDFQYAD